MPKTLLLADDSVTIQKVVGISFASEDVDLITVDNGDDAVTRTRESRPDVVLADVVMPGKNGYEVCEAIKSDPDLAHIPVLLLTGTFESFDEERASRCGAAGHVAKPFEAQTLIDRVHELLRSPLAAAATINAPSAGDPQATVIAETPLATIEVPAVPPAAAPAAPVAAGDEGFDFFDEEMAAPAAPAAPIPEPSAPALDLDASDSAFAFGDDDLGSPETTAAGDRTVAILPDDSMGPATPAAPTVTPLDDLLAEPSGEDTADDLLGASLEAPAAASDDFDFEIGGSLEGNDPLTSVGGDDLAQETVLDPKGASGFDVSSSDLGDPLEGMEPLAAPEPMPMASAEVTRMAPIEPVAASEPEPTVVGDDLFGGDDLAADPLTPVEPAATAFEMPDAPPASVDESALEELVPATPEPVAMPPAPAAAPPPPPAPEPVFEAMPEPVAPAAPAAMEEPPLAASHDPGSLAGVALAEIEPKLREQLHDTLEKIAWESLGDVTEQIVRQAVERVERIAWEVIPQMAETLIREEIRKMKGEE